MLAIYLKEKIEFKALINNVFCTKKTCSVLEKLIMNDDVLIFIEIFFAIYFFLILLYFVLVTQKNVKN